MRNYGAERLFSLVCLLKLIQTFKIKLKSFLPTIGFEEFYFLLSISTESKKKLLACKVPALGQSLLDGNPFKQNVCIIYYIHRMQKKKALHFLSLWHDCAFFLFQKMERTYHLFLSKAKYV